MPSGAPRCLVLSPFKCRSRGAFRLDESAPYSNIFLAQGCQVTAVVEIVVAKIVLLLAIRSSGKDTRAGSEKRTHHISNITLSGSSAKCRVGYFVSLLGHLWFYEIHGVPITLPGRSFCNSMCSAYRSISAKLLYCNS